MKKNKQPIRVRFLGLFHTQKKEYILAHREKDTPTRQTVLRFLIESTGPI